VLWNGTPEANNAGPIETVQVLATCLRRCIGSTPLKLAKDRGYREMVVLLKKSGAKVTEVWMRRSRTATARVMARDPARSILSFGLIYDLERAVDLYAFAAQSSDVGAFLQSPFSLR
jgi:hypothetical protein